MIINASESERQAVINTAMEMTCAARTAPKTKGIDRLGTLILLDNDIVKLSKEMIKIGKEKDQPFFIRDGKMLLNAIAVVLIAVNSKTSGLNEICQYCGARNCAEAQEHCHACAFASIDLGIAIGSAISIAANHRVDNRVLFSAGKAALEHGYFGKKYNQIIAVCLTCAGKNPFYDRTEQFGTLTDIVNSGEKESETDEISSNPV